ncbi:MAG: hypoxanthine phosphoribosyltransferase [Nanoarchaeota archaeon]|nr:hypoxanthine phosphoribosyltransferase [Nanoarchaeota archaeon]
MKKVFINANDFLLDSFKLAKQIYDYGFKPDFLVGIWRGGTPPAIAIQEFFEFKKINMNHYPIKTEFYKDINKTNQEVIVSGLKFLQEHLKLNNNLLIVDDVFDSGLTMDAVLKEIKIKNVLFKSIKIATVYYKPSRNKTKIKPDFYVHETDDWIIFPHELNGLSEEEIKLNKQSVFKIIK